MESISLKLPDRLNARLAEEAKRRHTSKSAVVRECVETVLRAADNEQDSSCLALAKDLAGCLNGPGGIATSTAFLNDFASERGHIVDTGQLVAFLVRRAPESDLD